MTTTIQILQDLENELENHVAEFERDVLVKIKDMDGGHSMAPDQTSERPERPEPQQTDPQRKFGVGAPWQGSFSSGQLSPGGRPSGQSQSSSPKKKGWKWKGLRGIWNWMMRGNADDHGKAGPSSIVSGLKDKASQFAGKSNQGPSQFSKDYKKESHAGRPTLTEYLETQKRYDQFANELISEIVDNTVGQDASELESHPVFGPMFDTFRDKIRTTFNKYRRLLGGEVTPGSFPSEEDPNHLNIGGDERDTLSPPDATVDDTSDDDIQAAMAQNPAVAPPPDKVIAKAERALARNNESLAQVIKMVRAGSIPEPDNDWFTGQHKIKADYLPHIIAWLIANGKVDDESDGNKRPVNIFNSQDVRESLRNLGYKGPGNVVTRMAARLKITKDKKAIEQQILKPLGWQHGAQAAPESVGSGDAVPSFEKSSPSPSPSKSWKDRSIYDFVDDAVGDPEQSSDDEPNEDELAAMHKAAGYGGLDPQPEPSSIPKVKVKSKTKTKTKPKKKDNPITADMFPSDEKPDHLRGEPRPVIKPKKPKAKERTSDERDTLSGLDDKIASIIDDIDDDEKKMKVAKRWNNLKSKLKNDKGQGDYTIQDLLDYLPHAEKLIKGPPGSPPAFLSHWEPGGMLRNESIQRSITASKMNAHEKKNYYKSLLRG